MENSLLTEINTDVSLKESFAKWFGMPLADIPEEIIAEAGMVGRSLGMPTNNPGGNLSAARGRAAEQDWVQGLAKNKKNIASTFRDPTQAGQPEMNQQPAEPKAGDFVVVDGKPSKIKDVKQMYGNDNFAYIEGQQAPIITTRLSLSKRVGKINVFKMQ